MEKASVFRRLHEDGILLLPNVWDAGSACLIESLGARALATTSAGVAWSQGYPDGDRLPIPALMQAVNAIIRVARVPVSVDIEGGYADDPAAVGELVGRIVGAGAVGINIEDGVGTPDVLCAKIEAAKSSAARQGLDLFVNARTDVYLRNLTPAPARLQEVLERGARYHAAGADGLFVPGVTDAAEIRAVASGTRLPLNVLARPTLPPAAQLAEWGVRRLSAGSWVASAALGQMRSVVASFLDSGNCAPLFAGWPYAEVNSLLDERQT